MNRSTYVVNQDDLYCFCTGKIERYGQTFQTITGQGLKIENDTVNFKSIILRKTLVEVADGGRLGLVKNSCLVVERSSALRIFPGGELQIDDGSLKVEAGGTFWCRGKIRVTKQGSLWLHGEQVPRRRVKALLAVFRVVRETEKYAELFVHGPGDSHGFAGWAIQILPDGAWLERMYGWWIAAVTLLGWEASHYFFEDREQVMRYLTCVENDN